jgi:hypothetical protein
MQSESGRGEQGVRYLSRERERAANTPSFACPGG